jgi:hypothetical protein
MENGDYGNLCPEGFMGKLISYASGIANTQKKVFRQDNRDFQDQASQTFVNPAHSA